MAETWEWRCRGKEPTKAEFCNKLLGKFEDLRSGEIMCPRCHFLNRATLPVGAVDVILAATARRHAGEEYPKQAREILNTAELMGLSRKDDSRIRLYQNDPPRPLTLVPALQGGVR